MSTLKLPQPSAFLSDTFFVPSSCCPKLFEDFLGGVQGPARCATSREEGSETSGVNRKRLRPSELQCKTGKERKTLAGSRGDSSCRLPFHPRALAGVVQDPCLLSRVFTVSAARKIAFVDTFKRICSHSGELANSRCDQEEEAAMSGERTRPNRISRGRPDSPVAPSR